MVSSSSLIEEFTCQRRALLISLSASVQSLPWSLRFTSSGNFSSKLKRVDFGGAIALVLFVFTLLYGMDRVTSLGKIAWPSPRYQHLLLSWLLCSSK